MVNGFVQVYDALIPTKFIPELCFMYGPKPCPGGNKGRGFIAKNFEWGTWWVCNMCFRPTPLNALNARLFRECEMCEDWYWVASLPDRFDICPACD